MFLYYVFILNTHLYVDLYTTVVQPNSLLGKTSYEVCLFAMRKYLYDGAIRTHRDARSPTHPISRR